MSLCPGPIPESSPSCDARPPVHTPSCQSPVLGARVSHMPRTQFGKKYREPFAEHPTESPSPGTSSPPSRLSIGCRPRGGPTASTPVSNLAPGHVESLFATGGRSWHADAIAARCQCCDYPSRPIGAIAVSMVIRSAPSPAARRISTNARTIASVTSWVSPNVRSSESTEMLTWST
jgi:hypothetical protein